MKLCLVVSAFALAVGVAVAGPVPVEVTAEVTTDLTSDSAAPGSNRQARILKTILLAKLIKAKLAKKAIGAWWNGLWTASKPSFFPEVEPKVAVNEAIVVVLRQRADGSYEVVSTEGGITKDDIHFVQNGEEVVISKPGDSLTSETSLSYLTGDDFVVKGDGEQEEQGSYVR